MSRLLSVVWCVSAGLLAGSVFAQNKEVDVFHWWVSGGERASMDVIKHTMQERGLVWQEGVAAGSGTARYTNVLRERVAAGRIPTAAQMIGHDIHAWARLGLLTNMNELARKEEWDEVVPIAIQALSKYNGNWVAAPVNAHSTNWLWVNQSLFDKLGGKEPDTWNDLIVLLDKAKQAGVLPIAIGSEAWEHTLLFESVAVSTGGAEFYRKAFIDLDPAALRPALLKKIFERMSKLRTYIDAGFSKRRWDQATDMVREGKALLQVQGSWVDGEFAHRGLVPNRDYYCFRFPDTQGVFLFNSDQFIMFKLPKERRDAQLTLASTMMQPSFQSALNVATGAAPARVDVSTAAFDYCGRKAISDMRGANMRRTMMGSIAMGNANIPPVKVAIYDVVTRHFTRQIGTDQAVIELRNAIREKPTAGNELKNVLRTSSHTPPLRSAPRK
ncbi:ABC transporter substrate-binding protein [Oxalicibacterium sp.]|uniref:ABC transporter substrate-binding protein n=1 Tax=Oxalicibacterium sp. TaxID=2766525 RepID=UPI002D7E8BD4|nr:ABC transporter substrate-binding protein [Oxalicibacterium sp.]